MKTITRTLIAGLVASVVFGSAAITNAQSPRSLFNQVVKSVQGPGQSFQAGPMGPNRQFQGPAKQFQGAPGNQFQGGHGSKHWFPQPPCGGGYCPPPPPVCHVYIVYYYDCHCGWKMYGTYHNYHAAQSAVHSLQHQGYRAYMQRARR